MSAKRKVGIVFAILLGLVIVGGIGLNLVEQSVKAPYKAQQEWRQTDEGLKNAFCHTQRYNFDACMSWAIVHDDGFGGKKVNMPMNQKGVNYNEVRVSHPDDYVDPTPSEHCKNAFNQYVISEAKYKVLKEENNYKDIAVSKIFLSL